MNTEQWLQKRLVELDGDLGRNTDNWAKRFKEVGGLLSFVLCGKLKCMKDYARGDMKIWVMFVPLDTGLVFSEGSFPRSKEFDAMGVKRDEQYGA